MNRNAWAGCFLGGMMAFGAAAAGAQEAAPPPPPPNVAGMPGDGGPGGPPPFAERIELLGFGGMHGGKVVKGVPFSALAVSESTQTLADGNRIVRKTETTLYRDGEGRFRKEVTLPAIGPLAASGKVHSFVVINDPVAGSGYILEPDEKVARKMPERIKGMKVLKREFGDREWKGKGETNTATESLGTQTLNGMSAEGTRSTRTIPAGEIGNEKPITIVSERWYSPDLQMVVKSTRSDPRFGTTTYTLTNVQRQEPDASLFTVPADYTVKEGGIRNHMKRFEGVAPPPTPPAPEN